MLDDDLDLAVKGAAFGASLQRRTESILGLLTQLEQHHRSHCEGYQHFVDAFFPAESDSIERMVDLPFLPIGLFKQRDLCSVPASEVFRVLASSGTTTSTPSRVSLDRVTAKRQTRALSSVMQSLLGPKRRPMLIVDAPSTVRAVGSLSARGAGVAGLMSFGRQHQFALDDTMAPDIDAVRAWLKEVEGQELLIFGFTFMVWQHLANEMAGLGLDLSGATVVHSGGWKRLEAQRVSPAEFSDTLRERFGITRVRNFYGMAEQVGSVFLEGDDGLLHPPAFAEVIVRDPVTWSEQPTGVPGVLQVLSIVPSSYPGHSILTEDLGVVETVDASPEGGKAFRVLGRVPKAELRGCSDTYAVARGH